MKYVAVGFKVNRDRTIFYIKSDTLEDFMDWLQAKIKSHDPDFVSLRMVRFESASN